MVNEVNKNESVWEIHDSFMRDYNLSLKTNQKFHIIVNEIIDELKITNAELQARSELSMKTIYRMRSGKIKNNKGVYVDYTPCYESIIAFCIACDLDMLMAIKLLDSLGLSFQRTNIIHYSYCYLIINCRGKSIKECNVVLEKLKTGKEHHLAEIA